MEKSGFVRRRRSSEDRRVLAVYITARGRKAYEKSEQAFAAVEESCFVGFSAQEKSQALLFLERIYGNLKKEGR